jgi:hypothetical protein
LVVSVTAGCWRLSGAGTLGQTTPEETASRNIAKHLRLPTAPAGRRDSWTTDEAGRFLESTRVDADPLYATYFLVPVRGLRKGETLGLTVDPIHLAGWGPAYCARGTAFCVSCRTGCGGFVRHRLLASSDTAGHVSVPRMLVCVGTASAPDGCQVVRCFVAWARR